MYWPNKFCESGVQEFNTNNRNILLGEKIYDNNLIYSDNGVLKITALNSITSFEKDLLIIDNGNVTTESINVDTIITNKLYDNLGIYAFLHFKLRILQH